MSSSESQSLGEARSLLRHWVRGRDDEVLAAIDTIGARAIRSAAEASARLDRITFRQTAEAALENLERLAREVSEPPGTIRERFFRRGKPAGAGFRERIGIVVDDLNRELDAVARAAIMVEGARRKLDDAATALEESRMLVHACTAALASVERELAFDQPDRARFFRESVHPRLLEREQDIVSQSAVTHQALLTLNMVGEGQDALARALVRARDISVAALRTAITARHTVADGPGMLRQAARIDRTFDAGPGGDGAERDLGRVLRDAAREARREIDAAETGA